MDKIIEFFGLNKRSFVNDSGERYMLPVSAVYISSCIWLRNSSFSQCSACGFIKLLRSVTFSFHFTSFKNILGKRPEVWCKFTYFLSMSLSLFLNNIILSYVMINTCQSVLSRTKNDYASVYLHIYLTRKIHSHMTIDSLAFFVYA